MEEENKAFEIVKLVLSGILLVLSLFLQVNETVILILRLAAAVISGYEILIKSFKNLLNKEFLDENTLMLIASVTAFVLGESAEGVLIVLLYNLGELLEDIATDRAREKIAGLAELKSMTANLFVDGSVTEVAPENVKVGSLLLVRKGDRVPIDGVIYDKGSEFDLKAVTGESRLFSLSKGEKIYSGAINLGDACIIKTEKLYKDSTVEKIIEMVEESTERKAKSQKFITTFAKIYTPCVVGFALLLAVIPPLFDGYNFAQWIYKALSFLIISCPCALVISVPLGFFIGIGSLAKRGILVKGGNYIDTLSEVKVAVFDKTGTLTKGEFSVTDIKAYNGFSKSEVLGIAAALEKHSSHPIAKAIILKADDIYKAEKVSEIAGKGIIGEIDGIKYSVGNAKILDNSVIENQNSNNNIVYLAKEGVLIGEIEISDSIKDGADNLVRDLKSVGVKNTVILSGDKKQVAEKVAKTLGIDCVYSELLPHEKTDKLNEISTKNEGKLLYAGDGINDAPSIAAADVGIAMGTLGSGAAIDCADVIITDDSLNKIPYAIKKSKLIKRKVITNIIASVGIKLAIMGLSVFTALPISIAMFADVGVMLLAVANSLSISLYK